MAGAAVLRSTTATMPRLVLANIAMVGAAVALAKAFFGLTIGGSIALYFVVWWTVLFVVLPFAARSEAADAPVIKGADPGAPATPRLREKVIWTTVWSDLVFLLVVAAFPLAGL